ncbi:hypothetical protein CJF42_25280, partial [Pseudoalteromonas sp. NBT06-2]|uniref:hypothetical protein n=1 Tax=Pseudoalteromonas sp. NBT06-2 TaxID=2025950 RepID=UPI000BCACB7D
MLDFFAKLSDYIICVMLSIVAMILIRLEYDTKLFEAAKDNKIQLAFISDELAQLKTQISKYQNSVDNGIDNNSLAVKLVTSQKA